MGTLQLVPQPPGLILMSLGRDQGWVFAERSYSYSSEELECECMGWFVGPLAEKPPSDEMGAHEKQQT